MDLLKERVRKLNGGIKIIEVSCRTGEGIDEWAGWLANEVEEYIR
jgi:hydrogenase nickel incorporation protein HypB